MSRRSTPEILKRLGHSLREIDPSTLQHDPEEGRIRWFQGEAATELTLWLDEEGRTRHAQLVFQRTSVEWSEAGISTGTFSLQSSTAGGRYDTYMLQLSTAVDPKMAEGALALLEASEIDPAVREALCDALRAAVADQAGA